ncbi:DNA excision repair protein ERCC-6-like [Megalops cyprinoides]|uniref:DNA excision repair protein ERCC-6-like n=1 Tax=Megalops cyprinoides TaxID=118141 RepID=UPI0018654720|nr:DNA excision repair protein ERCC-6-like [Megalops cyprinoides]
MTTKYKRVLGPEWDEDENQHKYVFDSEFLLDKQIRDKLYDHQEEGLAFFYKAFKEGQKGVTLADDMGLGKSIQVIAFLSGMIDMHMIKTVLLVSPTTLLKDWTDKLTAWAPGIKWKSYNCLQETSLKNLRYVQKKGNVLLISYKKLLCNKKTFFSPNGDSFHWDCVIFDEAHMLKNVSTKTYKAASLINSKFRILLTGTPIQNNLYEMWSLLSVIGPMLGTYRTFKKHFEGPITRARQADATPREKALGQEMWGSLMKKISPYWLRRSKEQIQEQRLKSDSNHPGKMDTKAIVKLPKKWEFVMWISLSPTQEKMYQEFLASRSCNETTNILPEIQSLMNLCNHPRQQNHWQKYDNRELHKLSTEVLLSESGKLTFLIGLLERLLEEGHYTVVFSQYRKMLDIIQHVLKKSGITDFLRIDGTTRLETRDEYLEAFQKRKKYRILLLTTKVGGVGLTITAANRVIIVDPCWNQAVDSQAMDRAYRMGQEQEVVVYRLITCGTVEEKIYCRQVFKSSLVRQAVGDDPNPTRHFTNEDLRETLILGETKFSVTQRRLKKQCPQQRVTDKTLKMHMAYIESLNVCGITDHELLFATKQEEDLTEEAMQTSIRDIVKEGEEKIEAESHFQSSMCAIGTKLQQPETVFDLQINHFC